MYLYVSKSKMHLYVSLCMYLYACIYIYMNERSLKSNFRQYGQMESRGGKSQRREEKRIEEERRSEKRKSQKKEDPGVRKSRKVAIHYVFPMICGVGKVEK